MKTTFFSIALLLGYLASLSAQDIYLPVSSSSETARSEYFKALQAGENANIPAFFDGLRSAKKTIEADVERPIAHPSMPAD